MLKVGVAGICYMLCIVHANLVSSALAAANVRVYNFQTMLMDAKICFGFGL